jgi:hypothetical protein
MDDIKLNPGDWFEIDFGFHPRIFYVVRVTDRGVWATQTTWLVSTQELFKWSELKDKNMVLIGSGKLRRWRAFLPGFRDLIPMYSKPSVLKS